MQILALPDYNLYVGKLAEALPAFIAQGNYSSLLVLVDENTQRHCLSILHQALQGRVYQTIEIPSGERNKNIDTCQLIWKQMMDAQADRNALLINLGGGVIGDMGGFCAATFKRGIPFVQIPTTLLSQVDASIGGKLGIDFLQLKNSIGLFQNPKAVFIDVDFFHTLPERELRSGFAEVIKHSLIADSSQWEVLQKLSSDWSSIQWERIVIPSIQVKQQIVLADPQEKGIRKALNFGHTIGHAVEGVALESDRALLHGEAIAIGMICEAYLSVQKLGLPRDALTLISQYLLTIYPHYELSEKDYEAYFQLMQNDKKNEAGQIKFSLIDRIGHSVVNLECPRAWVVESLEYYRNRGWE
ncbi:MAG TPA: 3-dehydroquinate synthase [Saprospiraceae bacterium]|nr:3-dehydroquinate synthase [Saprospiraceae bacterium]HMQ83309.1 3-dehydroquinate synthase [Saprospiraceae bacterium]